MTEEEAGESPEETRRRFEEANQGEVFRFWPNLNKAQRGELLAQATRLDLDEAKLAWADANQPAAVMAAAELTPAPFTPLPVLGPEPNEWREACTAGEAALADGKVAAFTVAGGQGTRLGYAGPKGEYPATPISQKPLFRLFAEAIRAAERRYGRPIHWFLMTSETNHESTRSFFKRHQHFGLFPERVIFFRQGMMPVLSEAGAILLETPSRMAMSPNGHGGSLKALVSSGATRTMRDEGIDAISYFQVDNPLVHCLDPAFIGFHIKNKSEMSSKAVRKTEPREKVGVFCRRDNRLCVLEYSDLPDELADARDPAGNLRFEAGSIAIHIINRSFVDEVGGGTDPSCRLPYHGARKKVPHLDAAGKLLIPDLPNALKLETFVFDALPFANNPFVLETARAEEFAPIKNAEGVDSPGSSHRLQFARAQEWLRRAGVLNLPENIEIEIAPSFAVSAAHLRQNLPRLPAGFAWTDRLVLSAEHLSEKCPSEENPPTRA